MKKKVALAFFVITLMYGDFLARPYLVLFSRSDVSIIDSIRWAPRATLPMCVNGDALLYPVAVNSRDATFKVMEEGDEYFIKSPKGALFKYCTEGRGRKVTIVAWDNLYVSKLMKSEDISPGFRVFVYKDGRSIDEYDFSNSSVNFEIKDFSEDYVLGVYLEANSESNVFVANLKKDTVTNVDFTFIEPGFITLAGNNVVYSKSYSQGADKILIYNIEKNQKSIIFNNYRHVFFDYDNNGRFVSWSSKVENDNYDIFVFDSIKNDLKSYSLAGDQFTPRIIGDYIQFSTISSDGTNALLVGKLNQDEVREVYSWLPNDNVDFPIYRGGYLYWTSSYKTIFSKLASFLFGTDEKQIYRYKEKISE